MEALFKVTWARAGHCISHSLRYDTRQTPNGFGRSGSHTQSWVLDLVKLVLTHRNPMAEYMERDLQNCIHHCTVL